MADNRPPVYEENGIWVYRASALGMCVRALVGIARDGYDEALSKDRKDLLERSADEGNLHEEGVREKLFREGYQIISTQDIAEIEVMPGVIIRGHTDGVLAPPDGGGNQLLEVKSMSNKVFDRWIKNGFEGFGKYAYQISAYMQANPDLDVLYYAKRREDGFPNTQIIKAGEPPISWKDIRKKVLTVESHRRKRASFPDCDLGKQDQWWCPLWYLHDETEPDIEEMTDEDQAVLADIIPERMRLKDIEDAGKEAEKERKALDKEILNLMGKTDKTIVKIDEDSYQITQVNSGGTNWDHTKLQSDLGEEALRYQSSYRYKYPKITKKKRQMKKGTT